MSYLFAFSYCSCGSQGKPVDKTKYLKNYGQRFMTLYGKMKVKAAQSCMTLCDSMDYTVHGILQARILEWVAFLFSRRSSQPRDRTQDSHNEDRFLKAGVKLNIPKTNILASGPITSRQIDGETKETVRNFIFLGSKITAGGDCSHEIKRHLLLGKAMTNLGSI